MPYLRLQIIPLFFFGLVIIIVILAVLLQGNNWHSCTEQPVLISIKIHKIIISKQIFSKLRFLKPVAVTTIFTIIVVSSLIYYPFQLLLLLLILELYAFSYLARFFVILQWESTMFKEVLPLQRSSKFPRSNDVFNIVLEQ